MTNETAQTWRRCPLPRVAGWRGGRMSNRPSRCRPETYADGWQQCSSCGQNWGDDGPDECPLEPLADDPPPPPGAAPKQGETT